jgi:hypothetical protein
MRLQIHFIHISSAFHYLTKLNLRYSNYYLTYC